MTTATAPSAGLSHDDVAARRARGQGNVVTTRSSRPYSAIFRENVFNTFNIVLFSVSLVLILLGLVGDAVVSGGVVLFNVVVNVVQEVRAKRKLDRIALLTRPKVHVIRAGSEATVGPEELVLGDLVMAYPGDQMVVDGEVSAGQMEVDESLLTGESDPVSKRPGDEVLSGCFCVSGSASYRVTRVGDDSLANRLTAGAREFRRVTTPLQHDIDLFVRILLLVASFLGVLLFFSSFVNPTLPLIYRVQTAAVILGLVPYGLFMMITITYAMGAVRMANQGAVVQQANGVESLSNVTVLCMDKTGTLTANRIHYRALCPIGVSETELARILGVYAASITASNKTNQAIADAFPAGGRATVAEVPFSSERKWSALSFDEPDLKGTFVLGAPELIAPEGVPEALAEALENWTQQGLRVVLLAHTPDVLTPAQAEQPSLPADLALLGLVSFSDELRPNVHETLAAFRAAGVRLKVISGDNPQTVAALARQAGLSTDLSAVSGRELARMDEATFRQAARDNTVFGRITPAQKEALVDALSASGEYVAMIGDGVNDVLSLKKARVGIAMESGAQATRSVADMILLDDSFAALPVALTEGQRILNGMEDILKLFLARVSYVALLIIAISALNAGFPLFPKHNGLLTFLTVTIPTFFLALWARPGLQKRNFIASTVRFALPAAFTITFFALLVYLGFFLGARGYADVVTAAESQRVPIPAAWGVAQSALTAFTILCGLLLIVFVEPPSRGWTGGDVLSGDPRPARMALAMLLTYLVILLVPPLRLFFDQQLLSPAGYALICALALVWALLQRYVWRARLPERFLGLKPPDKDTTEVGV